MATMEKGEVTLHLQGTNKPTNTCCHRNHAVWQWFPHVLSLIAFLISITAVVLLVKVLQAGKSRDSRVTCNPLITNPANANGRKELNSLNKLDKSQLEACCYRQMLPSSKPTKDVTSGHNTTNTSTPVSAHKHLLLPDRLPGTYSLADPIFSSTHRVVMKFDVTHTDLSVEHVRGVGVTEEALEILYDGLYFVYSNVNFKPNTTRPSEEFIYQTWFQYVSRNCARIPMMSGVLLRTVHTVCHNCTLSQETAFTGGVFNLFSGDQIQVVLSGQGLVGIDKHTTYIGLFMLASDT